MWVYLSHVLSQRTPSYGGGPGLTIQPYRQLARGDSNNSYILTLFNHLGTHVDAPNHFIPNGRTISSLSPEELFFHSPILVETPKDAGELLRKEDLEVYQDILGEADILLLRTGFQRYRDVEPDLFMNRGPCLTAGAARYLKSFPSLRAVGVDMISISSPLHREEGRSAHRELLSGRGFLIVEDMDLMGKPTHLKRVLVAPLMVEGCDSSPCLV
ncbi:MAG: cyclase family protein, partial [Nitrososphaerota archaeon]